MRLSPLIGAIALTAATIAVAQSPPVKVVKAPEPFDEVKQNVEDAVIKRGLVIDYTAHIGEMLERTAKDVGAAKKIYAKAHALQFCSAVLSRKTMEADPANIGFCPYVIFVYALEGEPNATYVGYRPLPMSGSAESQAALKAVNDLLDGIVRDASGGK
jgi:uncharacterized protein (DUF302 family)